MELSAKIRYHRKNQALTQEQLAEAANVTLRTIQRVENGETIPRGHTLLSIAKALGKDIKELQPDKVSNNEAHNTLPINKSYLHYLNLASFSYLIFPYGNLILPYLLWRRKRNDLLINEIGRKILMRQFLWTIGTHVSLLAALLIQLIAKYYYNISLGPVILFTFFFMYFINIPLILHTSYKLKKQFES